ncbi:MAG: hypothetical protein ACI8Y4_002460 [Candidatus Poriferisodalaceae bacterium]|jgi:hypothetical protein
MQEFIAEQHLFFVSTAPAVGGRVNMSPKGYDSFRVLGEHRVAYQDLTCSGSETIAHLGENGRIRFMFCAFDGKPNIVRLCGIGRVVLKGDEDFTELSKHFEERPGARSIIVADIDRTSNSCGYSIPSMEHVGDRTLLVDWAAQRTADDFTEYWATRNAESIDGLPSLG